MLPLPLRFRRAGPAPRRRSLRFRAPPPASDAAYLPGRSSSPSLLSGPSHAGLVVAFGFAIAACLVAASASWLRGKKYVHPEDAVEAVNVPSRGDDVKAALR